MNAVRDGKIVAPTCPECGCRLKDNGNTLWTHFFGSDDKRDARGCLCSMLTLGASSELGKVFIWTTNSVVIPKII